MPISYLELFEKFSSSIDWLNTIGVRVNNTRFDFIKTDLSDLLEVAKNRDLGRFKNEDDYVTGVYSLIEANDFINVHDAFKNRIGPNLINTLNIAVKGKKPGVKENQYNNKARNALAELSWGALLEKSKYSTSTEFEPDIVQFINPNDSIIWEVKRPLSKKQLLKRLKEGTSQINKAFSSKTQFNSTIPIGGCVVIFVENIIGSDPAVIFGGNNIAMDRKVRNELQLWWKQYRPDKMRYWKPGVLGVVLWWRLLGVNLLDPNSQFIDWNQRLFHKFHTSSNSIELEILDDIINGIYLHG